MIRKRRRNPELITPLGALKTAVSHRDMVGALHWFRVIQRETDENADLRTHDYTRVVRQRGEHHPHADWSERATAKEAQLRALGRSDNRRYPSSDLNDAYRVISGGVGKFFRELRTTLNITSSKRGTSPKKEPVNTGYVALLAKREHRDRLTKQRDEDKTRFASIRNEATIKARAIRREKFFPTDHQMKFEEKLQRLKSFKAMYPGIDGTRLRRSLDQLAGLEAGSPRSNDVLASVGIPASVLAGNWWKVKDPTLRSPADVVRARYWTPSMSAAIEAVGADPSDPEMREAVKHMRLPSVQQMRVAVNAATRRRAARSDATALAEVPKVDSWLSGHIGLDWYKMPAGWRFLREGDGEALVKWANRNNACTIDRITRGGLTCAGLAMGPKQQVLGVSLFIDGTARVGDRHECCDKNNNFDEAAWKWASRPQRKPTPAADREARQLRIANRKHSRRSRPIGSARESVRAEARGDWLHLATNPRRRARHR